MNQRPSNIHQRANHSDDLLPTIHTLLEAAFQHYMSPLMPSAKACYREMCMQAQQSPCDLNAAPIRIPSERTFRRQLNRKLYESGPVWQVRRFGARAILGESRVVAQYPITLADFMLGRHPSLTQSDRDHLDNAHTGYSLFIVTNAKTRLLIDFSIEQADLLPSGYGEKRPEWLPENPVRDAVAYAYNGGDHATTMAKHQLYLGLRLDRQHDVDTMSDLVSDWLSEASNGGQSPKPIRFPLGSKLQTITSPSRAAPA